MGLDNMPEIKMQQFNTAYPQLKNTVLLRITSTLD